MKRRIILIILMSFIVFSIFASDKDAVSEFRVTFAQSNFISAKYYSDENARNLVDSNGTNEKTLYAIFASKDPGKYLIDRVEIVSITDKGIKSIETVIPVNKKESGIVAITIGSVDSRIVKQFQIRPIAKVISTKVVLTNDLPGTWKVNGKIVEGGSTVLDTGTIVSVQFNYDNKKYYFDDSIIPKDVLYSDGRLVFPTTKISGEMVKYHVQTLAYTKVTVEGKGEISFSDSSEKNIDITNVSFKKGEVFYAQCDRDYEIESIEGCIIEETPIENKYKVIINGPKCIIRISKRGTSSVSLVKDNDLVQKYLKDFSLILDGKKQNGSEFNNTLEVTTGRKCKVVFGNVSDPTKVRIKYQRIFAGKSQNEFWVENDSSDSFDISQNEELRIEIEEGLWLIIPQGISKGGTIRYQSSDGTELNPGERYFFKDNRIIVIDAQPNDGYKFSGDQRITINHTKNENEIFTGKFIEKSNVQLTVPNYKHAKLILTYNGKLYSSGDTFEYEKGDKLEYNISDIESGYNLPDEIDKKSFFYISTQENLEEIFSKSTYPSCEATLVLKSNGEKVSLSTTINGEVSVLGNTTLSNFEKSVETVKAWFSKEVSYYSVKSDKEYTVSIDNNNKDLKDIPPALIIHVYGMKGRTKDNPLVLRKAPYCFTAEPEAGKEITVEIFKVNEKSDITIPKTEGGDTCVLCEYLIGRETIEINEGETIELLNDIKSLKLNASPESKYYVEWKNGRTTIKSINPISQTLDYKEITSKDFNFPVFKRLEKKVLPDLSNGIAEVRYQLGEIQKEYKGGETVDYIPGSKIVIKATIKPEYLNQYGFKGSLFWINSEVKKEYPSMDEFENEYQKSSSLEAILEFSEKGGSQ